MVTHIATCGDSFGVGTGLPQDRCFEDSFGGIIASHFNLPQKVYARAGCCNFVIYLQIKKIIEQIEKDETYKPFVLVTTTYHERLIFPLDNGTIYKNPNLSDVEYKSYNPYHDTTHAKGRELAFESKKNTRLVAETISNIKHFQDGKADGIARLFAKVDKSKLEAIKSYYTDIFDTGIKSEYDQALIITMSFLLKKFNIPHVIMGYPSLELTYLENFMPNDWGYYTRLYPDTMGSSHCNEEGNRLVGENVINFIKEHHLI